MARIKIEIQGTCLGTVIVPVRITDVNYGGHVGNDAIVALLHEARVQWLKQHSYSEMDFAGSALIMSGLSVEFKNEAFFGDELSIEIYAGEITRVGFELLYVINTIRQQKHSLIARAMTNMVCFNYQTKKLIPVPEAGITLLTS
jgi:acyl-CoA thioesterase FadM